MQISDRMQRSVVTLERDDSLSLAVQVMGWNNVRHLPVLEGGRVVGMLSERDILRWTKEDLRGRIEGSVADAMSAPVKIAPPTMSLEEAAAILAKDRIGALPVVALGQVVGILTTTDVLAHSAQCRFPWTADREPTVDDVMTRSVEVALADDRVADAAARMRTYGVRHLPVVDGEMRVLGLLSESDVVRATGAELLELGWGEREGFTSRVRVEAAMTRDPRTLPLGASIHDVVRALVEERVGALPVTDREDHLRGIVSYVDLLRFLDRPEA